MKNKFVKNVMEATVGAIMIPVAHDAISGAGMGQMGNAANATMGAGFLHKISKKLL